MGGVIVYDKKGNIIDKFDRTSTTRPQIALALSPTFQTFAETIPGETILNSKISNIQFPFDFDPREIGSFLETQLFRTLEYGKYKPV